MIIIDCQTSHDLLLCSFIPVPSHNLAHSYSRSIETLDALHLVLKPASHQDIEYTLRLLQDPT